MAVLTEKGGVIVENLLTRSFSCASAYYVSSFCLHIQPENAGLRAESERRGDTKRMKDKKPKRASVTHQLRWGAVLEATFIDRVDKARLNLGE